LNISQIYILMDSVEIPDDFYICRVRSLGDCSCNHLAHKSCIYRNHVFSSYKRVVLINCSDLNKKITELRHKCNIIDEIEEKTYFVDNIFNNLAYGICRDSSILLCNKDYSNKFANINDFLEYLDKNCPECIRNNDIKIALKD